ncbi:MAG: hypothetical protein GY810_13210 [Aureispira sp.]|nr:hypothetical protein [Aureispira sp.]
MQFLQKNRQLLVLLAIQAVLCIIAFNKFFGSPNDYMFSNRYDGIKNYFTYQAYLEQDPSLGFGKLMQQGYPYGDYIFYADLSPSIAVPIKLFSTYIYDLSPYGVTLFNLACILLQLISVFFSYKLISRFIKTKWLASFMSICLVWISPQFFGLYHGTFNLGLGFCILAPLWALLKIYDHYQEHGNFSTGKKHFARLGILTVFIAFIHLYYLMIIAVSSSFFALFWFIDLWLIQKKEFKKSLVPLFSIGALLALEFIVVMGIVRTMDSYYHLRSTTNSSYGWDAIKLQVGSLFTYRPAVNSITFPFAYKKGYFDGASYLGSFTLYGLLVLTSLRLFLPSKAIKLKTIFAQQRLFLTLFATSIIIFLIAIGEEYKVGDDYILFNYLNPFFYLHKVTTMVEHFRSLVRFFWVAFWIWSIGAVFIADYYWRNSNNNYTKGIILFLVFLSLIDLRDTVAFQNTHSHKNYFQEQQIAELAKLPTKDYQAILPVPFYHDSSEESGYVLNGNGGKYNRMIFSMSLQTGLPTISIQSSRIPIKHTKQVFSIFTDPQPQAELLDQFSEKPILVALLKETANIPMAIPSAQPGKNVATNGKHIIQKYNMQKVAESAQFIFYKWDLTRLKNPAPPVSIQTFELDAEQISDSSKVLISSDKLLTCHGTTVQSSDKARSGNFSIQLDTDNPYGFTSTINNVKANDQVEVSVWRHKDSPKGLLVVQGKDYYISQEDVVTTEGNWQFIKTNCIIPNNFEQGTLKFYYWNNKPTTVWLDDFKVVHKVY